MQKIQKLSMTIFLKIHPGKLSLVSTTFFFNLRVKGQKYAWKNLNDHKEYSFGFNFRRVANTFSVSEINHKQRRRYFTKTFIFMPEKQWANFGVLHWECFQQGFSLGFVPYIPLFQIQYRILETVSPYPHERGNIVLIDFVR